MDRGSRGVTRHPAKRAVMFLETARAACDRSRRGKEVPGLIDKAIAELNRAVDSGITAAAQRLDEDLIVALGPQTTVDEIKGARRVLQLNLAALPLPGGGAS